MLGTIVGLGIVYGVSNHIYKKKTNKTEPLFSKEVKKFIKDIKEDIKEKR